jgi:hypothetical protein
MLVRPEGLVPSARRKAELRPEDSTLEGDIGAIDQARPTGTGEPTLIAEQERQTLYDARELNENVQEKR